MTMLRTWLLLVCAVLATGCIVRETRPPPPPPPMSDGEAIQRGEQVCAQRGFDCRVTRVTRYGNVVQVDFDAASQVARGPLRIEFGVFDRRILRVEEPRPAPPPPPPPVARPMDEREAVTRGYDWCRNHGFGCELKEVHLEQNARWKMHFRLHGGGRGHVKLTFDAYSRQLLDADQHLH